MTRRFVLAVSQVALVAALAALLLLAACGGGSTQDSQRLSSLEPGLQEASYAMGVDMGKQSAGMVGIDDHDVVIRGLKDQIADQAKLDFVAAREIMSVQPHDHGDADADHDHEDTWTENGFADEMQQRSYAVGVILGQFAHSQLSEIDTDAFAQGLTDKLDGKELLCDETTARETVMTFQRELVDKLAVVNLEKGQAWLAENAKRDGVVTTASGLQYEVVEKGDGGEHPEATSTVTVHYNGTLIDGTKFDSSYDRGEPATFPLNGVIPGWTEGLQLMTKGDKFKFFIPTELGYGMRYRPGGVIGPNDALVFDVELLEIK